MKAMSVILTLGVLLVCGTLQAELITYSDSTCAPSGTCITGVFDRPNEGLGAIEELGVSYHAFTFSPLLTATYTFQSLAGPLSDDDPLVLWDNFLILYGPTFDPLNPLASALFANDDFPNFGDVGQSSFTYDLTAGASYVLVTAGYDADEYGTFDNTISSPSENGEVPEPATFVLLGAGLVGLGALRFRRKVR